MRYTKSGLNQAEVSLLAVVQMANSQMSPAVELQSRLVKNFGAQFSQQMHISPSQGKVGRSSVGRLQEWVQRKWTQNMVHNCFSSLLPSLTFVTRQPSKFFVFFCLGIGGLQFGGQQFHAGMNGAGSYGVSWLDPPLFNVSLILWGLDCPVTSIQVLVKAPIHRPAKENMVCDSSEALHVSWFSRIFK